MAIDDGPEFEILRRARRFEQPMVDVFLEAVRAFRDTIKVTELEDALSPDSLDFDMFDAHLALFQDVLRDAFIDGARFAQGTLPAQEEVTKRALHYRAQKGKKASCQRCGSTSFLLVHHRDGDAAQQSSHRNLETLCKRCHQRHHLGKESGSVSEQLVGVFDLDNIRAREWLRAEGGRLIREVSQDTRQAVIEVISEGFNQGWTRRRISQGIRKIIGLGSWQVRAAMRFDRALNVLGDQDLSDMTQQTQDLLQRGGIRSTQFGRIKRIGLRPGEAAKISAKYREKSLRYRAMTIARTESITALSAGQQEVWTQAAEQGLIVPDEIFRQWNVTRDERLDRRICAPMAKQRVPFSGLFLTGDGRMIMHPSAHPNCRCTVTLYDPLSEIGRTR